MSRSRQAERQRAERYEPRLAGEIVKEIIADARIEVPWLNDEVIKAFDTFITPSPFSL